MDHTNYVPNPNNFYLKYNFSKFAGQSSYNMNKLLLNTSYFPPVSYFSELRKYGQICIEQYESYGKQSYRNRCEIMSANGVMPLAVPVFKGSELKILTKDARIDYATPWQKLHLRSIESAYRNSPYYDYYIDDIIGHFSRKEIFLIDLNNRILNDLLDLLNLKREISLTDDYIKDATGYTDLRDAIHPKVSRKKGNLTINSTPYHQTFNDRFPFVPNLSILDLLFNMGPESSTIL